MDVVCESVTVCLRRVWCSGLGAMQRVEKGEERQDRGTEQSRQYSGVPMRPGQSDPGDPLQRLGFFRVLGDRGVARR